MAHYEVELSKEEWKKPKGVAYLRLSGYEGALIEETAKRKIRRILDALNFYSDIAYSQAHPAILYLTGEKPSGKSVSVNVVGESKQEILSPTLRRIAAFEEFDFRHLSKKHAVKAGSKIALRLLRNEQQRTAMERRLLTALEWAGRATAERRLEQEFLLYLISTEALVLGPQNASEVGFRLRLGISHLLGRNKRARLDIQDKFKKTYTIRSKIIHAGQLGVTEKEVDLARSFAKNAIVAAMYQRELRQLQSDKDIGAWFLARAAR